MEQINSYIKGLTEALNALDAVAIERVIEVLQEARLQRRQVFIMGNGGSASTASHFACDLAKNTRLDGWLPFKVMSLADNMATFSAYANDEGYDQVFAQQLDCFIVPGDVVIGISTSGNSPNVLNAIRLATERNALTIGLTGFDGGALSALVNIELHVDCACIEQVEDIHLALEHLITKALRERLAGTPQSAFSAAGSTSR